MTATGAHLNEILSIRHLVKQLSRAYWARAWNIMNCVRRLVKVVARELCNYGVLGNLFLAYVPV